MFCFMVTLSHELPINMYCTFNIFCLWYNFFLQCLRKIQFYDLLSFDLFKFNIKYTEMYYTAHLSAWATDSWAAFFAHEITHMSTNQWKHKTIMIIFFSLAHRCQSCGSSAFPNRDLQKITVVSLMNNLQKIAYILPICYYVSLMLDIKRQGNWKVKVIRL